MIKLHKLEGKVAIIIADDMAWIVDADELPSKRVGTEMEIVDMNLLLSRATPYGIDWSVVIPDGIYIDPLFIQKVLYSRGIISLDDLRTNPNVLAEAIGQLLKMKGTLLYKLAKEVLGG